MRYGNDIIKQIYEASPEVLILPSGSVLTIGGIRKFIDAQLSLNLAIIGIGGTESAAIASTLYYVYVILDSGNPQLIASTSASGPVGYNAFYLIDRFYTDGSVEIGQIGESVAIRKVIASFKSGNNEYTVYSDGWVIQSGFLSNEGTVNYIMDMADNTYSIALQKVGLNTGSERPDTGLTSKVAGSFTVDKGSAGGSGFFWRVEGFADPAQIAAQGIFLE